MNHSPEVAMTVIEPGGRRWAQLLSVGQPVRDLLPLILSRLDLPQRLDYQLHHVRSGYILRERDSLQSVGIAPGEELQLQPVRNKLLTDLLDALYQEAVGYVAKQLWGQAESRLETIFRLEPNYPDPRGLKQVLRGRPAAPGQGYAVEQPLRGAPAGPPPPAGASPPPVAPASTAAVGSRSGCAIVGTIVGGLVLLVVVLAVAGIGWFLLRSPEGSEGGFNPSGNPEPVLGTGDVQVTLRWDNAADLDLHVVDPAGEEIWYGSSSSTSGGTLDVDANGDCSNDPPVENVFWPTGGAPDGLYQVEVVYYGACDTAAAANYEVSILVDGQVVDRRSGTLASAGESHFIAEFTR
jgi:hypothetical protein